MYKRKRTNGYAPAKRARTSAPRKAIAKSRRPFVRPISVGDELKFFDTALAFSIDATGEVPATGQLSLITLGDAENERNGRKVLVKSIQIQGMMLYVPAAANAAGVTKLHLVLDTAAIGTAAASSVVWESTDYPSALRDPTNFERFKVLKTWTDEWFTEGGIVTAGTNKAKAFSYYSKCNIPLTFAPGAGGAIGDMRLNNIFLMAGCSTAIDDLVTVSGTCRLRFSDNS